MKIEICKEESINGRRWKWRATHKNGSRWNVSREGMKWIASNEGVRVTEDIEKSLDVISQAIADSRD